MKARLRSNGHGVCHRPTNFFGCCERRRLYARHPFFTRPRRMASVDRHDNDVADAIAYLRLGNTQLPLMHLTASAAVCQATSRLVCTEIIWFFPDLLRGRMAGPIPRVSISWSARNGQYSARCLCALLLIVRGTDVPARAKQRLKPQGGLAAFPNVWFSTLVHIRLMRKPAPL